MTDGHGQRAEDAMEAISHRLFGCDLVLRSPVLVEASGPKELTDFLVLVDDTAVVVQSKSIDIDVTELDATKFGRIMKRHRKAKRQLNTTLNAQKRGAHVHATTPLGVEFDLDWNWVQHRVGIITLHVPDEQYEDPECRFQFPYPVEEHNGITVHTFMLRDLSLMATELTTPADVLAYLSTRQRCLGSGKFMIGNELDFLAHFKTHYPEIDRALSDPSCDLEVLSPGLWEYYRKAYAEQIHDRASRFQNSILIDRLVRELGTSVQYSAKQYNITPQESAGNYLRLVGKFGKLARLERAQIGDMLMKKVEKTKRAEWGYFMHVSLPSNTAYLFLLFNGDDREERRRFLESLCVQACHSLECPVLVAVAMPGAQDQHPSIDALVLDVADIKANTEPDPDCQVFKEGVSSRANEWKS